MRTALGVGELAVADELRDHVFTLAARANGAGLAMMNARHGVVEMRQVRRARVKHCRCLFIGAVRMRDRDGAELRHLLSKLDRAGQLRCHIRDAEKTLGSVIKVFERGKIRLSQIRAVLRALFLLGEERPLHLNAHETGTALRLLVSEPDCRFVRRFQHVVGQCHGRGREAGHAVLREIACHFDKAVIVAVREIRTGIAVIVDIDQSGDDILVVQVDAALCGDRGQYLGKSSVFRAEGAVSEFAAHKNIGILKKHIVPPQTLPPPHRR